ncbi:MAG TPA: O-antigen ligase family protein [Hyphomicrobium sp.]|nr:O-antigen ligase family protein [Hyphomicrobium sp.]
MFSSQLDRARHPLSGRLRGFVLGTMLMIAAAAALVSPRTAAFTFWVTAVGFAVSGLWRRDIDWKELRPGPVAFSFAAFFGYALLSAAWAAHPSITAQKAGLGLLVAASAMLMVGLLQRETRPNLVHMGEGVVLGMLLGIAFLAVEVFGDQPIKLAIYRALELRPADLRPEGFFVWKDNYLQSISPEDLTRNMTDAALFLWPAVMAALGVWWRFGRVTALVLAAVTVATIMGSKHASSQLALLVGFAAFALSRLSLRWTWRVTVVAWFGICLAVMPLVFLAHRAELHEAEWLYPSARHRVIIWNYTAEKTLESPWHGIGANQTYLLGPSLEAQIPNFSSNPLARTLSIHAHNVYLQTWFELGLIGALLLAAAGFFLLRAIRNLAPRLQPYGFATFASCAAMVSTSYGMWQVWLVTSLGLTATLFAVGAQCLEGDAHPERTND